MADDKPSLVVCVDPETAPDSISVCFNVCMARESVSKIRVLTTFECGRWPLGTYGGTLDPFDGYDSCDLGKFLSIWKPITISRQ